MITSILNAVSDPGNPLATKIQQYVERLIRSKTEIFDEASRKRGPPEPTDGLDIAKRQRLNAQVPAGPTPQMHIPSLPPGPVSAAQLFTITDDEGLKAFDVGQLSSDLVAKIGLIVLQRTDNGLLDQAISVRHVSSI